MSSVRMRVCLHSVALSERACPLLSELAGYSAWQRKKLLVFAGQLSIVLASVLQRGLPGQIPSAMYSTIAAEQSRLSGVAGLWLYTGSFSSERVRGTGCTDNSHTENLISFSVTMSAKVYTSFFLYPVLSLSGESSQRSRITERVCPCVITWFCNVTLQNCCGAGVRCAGLPGSKWFKKKNPKTLSRFLKQCFPGLFILYCAGLFLIFDRNLIKKCSACHLVC